MSSNCLILFLLHRVCDDRLALGQPDGASDMFNRQGFTLLILQQYLLLRQLILLLLFFLFVFDTDFGEWPSRAECFLLAVIRFNNLDNSFLLGQRPCRLAQIQVILLILSLLLLYLVVLVEPSRIYRCRVW